MDREDLKNESIKKAEARREYWDRKCELLAKTVKVEIEKRDIDITDEDAMAKIEVIISEFLERRVFKNRFQQENYNEVLNAVKRYINRNLVKEEGPSLDE